MPTICQVLFLQWVYPWLVTNAIKQSKVRREGWRGRSVWEGVTEDNVNKDLESLSETYKDLGRVSSGRGGGGE